MRFAIAEIFLGRCTVGIAPDKGWPILSVQFAIAVVFLHCRPVGIVPNIRRAVLAMLPAIAVIFLVVRAVGVALDNCRTVLAVPLAIALLSLLRGSVGVALDNRRTVLAVRLAVAIISLHFRAVIVALYNRRPAGPIEPATFLLKPGLQIFASRLLHVSAQLARRVLIDRINAADLETAVPVGHCKMRSLIAAHYPFPQLLFILILSSVQNTGSNSTLV